MHNKSHKIVLQKKNNNVTTMVNRQNIAALTTLMSYLYHQSLQLFFFASILPTMGSKATFSFKIHSKSNEVTK